MFNKMLDIGKKHDEYLIYILDQSVDHVKSKTYVWKKTFVTMSHAIWPVLQQAVTVSTSSFSRWG